MSLNAASSALTPVAQVFNTTELLEHILSFLPMPQVLGKARVARNWKAVIDESPALQKKLFFRQPDNQTEVFQSVEWSPQPPIRFDILGTEDSNLLFSLVNMPVYNTPIELNPLVDWENPADLLVSHEMRAMQPKPIHPSLSGLTVIAGKYSRAYVHRRFPRPKSWHWWKLRSPSWRYMYLTSPPIIDVVINVPTSISGRLATKYLRVNVHAEHGITLGLLRDKVEETLLRAYHMKDVKILAGKKKDGPPLQQEDFVRCWGKEEHPMFLVQSDQDAPTDEVQ
jgi:hypothetical protein